MMAPTIKPRSAQRSDRRELGPARTRRTALRTRNYGKIHHAAFDAHLIGIDPDYRLHVSERLLMQNDGAMLEALKRLNGGTIHKPKRDKDLPDRNRLALRFERFKAAA